MREARPLLAWPSARATIRRREAVRRWLWRSRPQACSTFWPTPWPGGRRTSGLEPAAIHERLARAWGVDDKAPRTILSALVLLADHELNASTFAARVAASTGASLTRGAGRIVGAFLQMPSMANSDDEEPRRRGPAHRAAGRHRAGSRAGPAPSLKAPSSIRPRIRGGAGRVRAAGGSRRAQGDGGGRYWERANIGFRWWLSPRSRAAAGRAVRSVRRRSMLPVGLPTRSNSWLRALSSGLPPTMSARRRAGAFHSTEAATSRRIALDRPPLPMMLGRWG